MEAVAPVSFNKQESQVDAGLDSAGTVHTELGLGSLGEGNSLVSGQFCLNLPPNLIASWR